MNILYYAIITLCPADTVCNTSDKFIKYFSEPYAIEEEETKIGYIMSKRCREEADKLRKNITIDGRQSVLCVQKDVWDRMHR